VTSRRLLSYLKSSLWFVPVLCVVGGAVLSFGALALDRAFDYEAIPPDVIGGPDAVTAILSTIAASMVSLTALVLTITMVVVQLAMGQFSPRIVQRILRDKPSQLAIGLFVATFAHAILTLREVTNEGDGTGTVPGIAVVMAFVLSILSIAVLVLYVHHIGQSLRVSSLIELVGTETRKLIDRVYPDHGSDVGGGTEQVVRSRESGVVTAIGHEELVKEAARMGCVLEVAPTLGEFVPADAPLIRIHGDPIGVDEDALHGAIMLDLERSLDEDVSYGIRLLVDIAERSLSDSPFQDPTTAVQAIDRLHDILRQLARRPFPDGRYHDADGALRVIVPVTSWDAYVRLAFEEIRLVGAESPQISRRLLAALADLKDVAPPDRVGVLDEEIDRLREAVRRRHDDTDVAMALEADPEGIGDAIGGDGTSPVAHVT
jgi:uncharacterized membrane protein